MRLHHRPDPIGGCWGFIIFLAAILALLTVVGCSAAFFLSHH